MFLSQFVLLMLGQLAVKGNGLRCEECQVHGAAVSVGVRGGMEKRAAGLRSARQTLGCTYSLPGSTAQQAFLGHGHAALFREAAPGLEPCLTKMRKACEPCVDSQGKRFLLRAPTSRFYSCPSSSQAKALHLCPFPLVGRGSGVGPVLCISVLPEPSPGPACARHFESVE